tara:strand:- start:26 stop:229 length:204 start_codon:yes stop_codon:yes gene_type:complete
MDAKVEVPVRMLEDLLGLAWSCSDIVSQELNDREWDKARELLRRTQAVIDAEAEKQEQATTGKESIE